MKRIQPDTCERCGAALALEGDMCYQRNCTYTKQTRITQTINEAKGGKDLISEQLEENKEKSNGGLRIASKNEKDEGNKEESFLEELQGGCIWGFFKLLWNIITFPIKLILRILSIFD